MTINSIAIHKFAQCCTQTAETFNSTGYLNSNCNSLTKTRKTHHVNSYTRICDQKVFEVTLIHIIHATFDITGKIIVALNFLN